ncbi:hypothetical protein [Gimesia sp.]
MSELHLAWLVLICMMCCFLFAALGLKLIQAYLLMWWCGGDSVFE